MIIREMRATFGALRGARLTLGEGLNILQAPNEGGKSTWSAFLRAMLYGINTKERDRQGYLAEKNRYQPWSGAAMEGEVTLTWRGRDITLRRGPRGSVPFGAFEAVYTGTGEAVPGLTGENAGETLLGAPREVFERSAFVGQGGTAIDGAPALEARIAALASSGEEDVSSSQVERRLKDWRNRRQHNKTGLIPKLEGELAVLDDTLARQAKAHRLGEEARRELERLQEERSRLKGELEAHHSEARRVQRARYEAAQADLAEARAQLEALERETAALPPVETLRAAQGDLSYLNTLNSNLKLADSQLEAAREGARTAAEAAEDAAFPDLTAEQARRRAQEDEAEVEDCVRRVKRSLVPVLIILAAVLGLVVVSFVLFMDVPMWVHVLLNGGGVAALIIAWLVIGLGNKKRKARLGGILDRYGARDPEGIRRRLEDYLARRAAADEAARALEALERAQAQLAGQREELKSTLLALVRPFAPAVTDFFGVSAALSRALGLEEKCTAARVRLEGAQRLADSLSAPEGGEEAQGAAAPRFDPAETAARLHAVEGEISRLRGAHAMAQGELNTLGDPALFQARREALLEELERRREEYDALELALEALEGANGELQARFSPALNRRSGEILSALTGGRYDRVTLTRQFEALAAQEDALLPRRALSLSQGAADQLYLAVRLAVCELALPGEEPVPLVLDDALVSFDEARMALALDYFRALGRERQILLFTCHSREGDYLRGQPGVDIRPLQS